MLVRLHIHVAVNLNRMKFAHNDDTQFIRHQRAGRENWRRKKWPNTFGRTHFPRNWANDKVIYKTTRRIFLVWSKLIPSGTTQKHICRCTHSFHRVFTSSSTLRLPISGIPKRSAQRPTYIYLVFLRETEHGVPRKEKQRIIIGSVSTVPLHHHYRYCAECTIEITCLAEPIWFTQYVLRIGNLHLIDIIYFCATDGDTIAKPFFTDSVATILMHIQGWSMIENLSIITEHRGHLIVQRELRNVWHLRTKCCTRREGVPDFMFDTWLNAYLERLKKKSINRWSHPVNILGKARGIERNQGKRWITAEKCLFRQNV